MFFFSPSEFISTFLGNRDINFCYQIPNAQLDCANNCDGYGEKGTEGWVRGVQHSSINKNLHVDAIVKWNIVFLCAFHERQ